MPQIAPNLKALTVELEAADELSCHAVTKSFSTAGDGAEPAGRPVLESHLRGLRPRRAQYATTGGKDNSTRIRPQ